MLRAPRRSCLCKIREGCPVNWEEQKSAGAWGVKKGGERVLLQWRRQLLKTVAAFCWDQVPKERAGRDQFQGSQCLGSQQGALV